MELDLFNVKNLIEICKKYNLSPSKKYGQNFLISKNVIDRIIEESNLKETNTVVEIGPGFGVLTLALAKQVKKVISFEIEKKLEEYWADIVSQTRNDNIEIIWGDVLREIESQKSIKSINSYKVVANLPYQITSNVIRKFLGLENKPDEMILMVQKEVGERICAKPGQMSLLAASVQFYTDPKILFNVKRTKFWPEPKVDSVVIKLKIKDFKLDINEKDFFRIVKVGFSSKRKMLLKNLKALGKNQKELEDVFKNLGLDLKIRAQELDVEKWVQIARVLNNK